MLGRTRENALQLNPDLAGHGHRLHGSAVVVRGITAAGGQAPRQSLSQHRSAQLWRTRGDDRSIGVKRSRALAVASPPADRCHARRAGLEDRRDNCQHRNTDDTATPLYGSAGRMELAEHRRIIDLDGRGDRALPPYRSGDDLCSRGVRPVSPGGMDGGRNDRSGKAGDRRFHAHRTQRCLIGLALAFLPPRARQTFGHKDSGEGTGTAHPTILNHSATSSPALFRRS
jgi:hypothetical protein